MDGIFLDITVIICLATLLSLLFRFLKQPSILAYILTGILLGPVGLFHISNTSDLQSFGYVGITLLLFMLGLELRLKELVSIGKTAVMIGFLQVWFTFAISFVVMTSLHYTLFSAFFICIALTFSSTVILVKIFSDKKDLNSLHGKLAIGISLTQDLAAVLLLIFISNSHLNLTPLILGEEIGVLLLKVCLVFGVIIFLSNTIFPRLITYVSRSTESLFLFSLAWVFFLAAVLSSPLFGFSIEIGGFLAGLALANTNETYQIIGRMKPLRDFFITIFFVLLGLKVSFVHFWSILPQVFLFSFFAICIKPVIILFLSAAFGFRKRTSLFVSISLGQISEFSLLVIFLVSPLLPSDVVTSIVLASLISFAFSSYAMQKSNDIYRHISQRISFLETTHVHRLQNGTSHRIAEMRDHYLIIGAHQMGMSILDSLGKDEHVIVVDFDPDVVHKLRAHGIDAFFGDISDPEIQERVGLDRAKFVVSTIPDVEDNLSLIQRLNKENKRAKVVVMSYEEGDAKRLYAAGADYVVLPHLAGGRHLAKILRNEDSAEMEKYKQKDMEFFT